MSATVIHLLPKTHSDAAVWARLIAHQRSFRLESLRVSPESFSSTYEREAAFSDNDWDTRFRNPLAHTIIATRSSNRSNIVKDELDDITQEPWVGCAVLFGPVERTSESVGGDGPDKLLFEIFGLFVLPEARAAGIGKSLVEAAVNHARALGRNASVQGVEVKVSATASNTKVLALYQNLGFVKAVDGVGSGGTTVFTLQSGGLV